MANVEYCDTQNNGVLLIEQKKIKRRQTCRLMVWKIGIIHKPILQQNQNILILYEGKLICGRVVEAACACWRRLVSLLTIVASKFA